MIASARGLVTLSRNPFLPHPTRANLLMVPFDDRAPLHWRSSHRQACTMLRSHRICLKATPTQESDFQHTRATPASPTSGPWASSRPDSMWADGSASVPSDQGGTRSRVTLPRGAGTCPRIPPSTPSSASVRPPELGANTAGEPPPIQAPPPRAGLLTVGWNLI